MFDPFAGSNREDAIARHLEGHYLPLCCVCEKNETFEGDDTCPECGGTPPPTTPHPTPDEGPGSTIDDARRWVRTLVEAAPDISITPDDIYNHPVLLQLAEEYARMYEGNFDFMRQMREVIEDPQRQFLSAGQAKGVLNCMRAEIRRELRKPKVANYRNVANPITKGGAPPPSKKRDAILPHLTPGFYTIVHLRGNHTTLRIKTMKSPHRMGMPDGAQVAEYLYGPGNMNDYKGFAFVLGRTPYVWNAFKDSADLVDALNTLLAADEDAQREAGKSYAMASGNCYVCGKLLTDPISIEEGIGPICAGRIS